MEGSSSFAPCDFKPKEHRRLFCILRMNQTKNNDQMKYILRPTDTHTHTHAPNTKKLLQTITQQNINMYFAGSELDV